MQIRIRHVSGSKAGTEQTFNADSVRLGREPSSDIAFDPYRDILVSGRHLEIAFDGRNWVARDLGSTNGTYVNGERVTTHPLVSGEMLELGQGGPKIEVYFETPGRGVTSGGSVQTERPGTTVMSVNDLFAGRRTSSGTTPIASGADDGTTTLAPEEMAAIRAQATRATPPTVQVPAARKRVSSAPRIVLLGMLVVVAGLILFVIMGRKAAPPVVAADPARAEVERLKNELAEKEAQLAQQQQQQARATSTDTNAIVSNDMERQFRESQEVIDRLRRELGAKNDEVARAEKKPPQTIIKYLPQPVPAPQPAPQLQPAPTAVISAVPTAVPAVQPAAPAPAPSAAAPAPRAAAVPLPVTERAASVLPPQPAPVPAVSIPQTAVTQVATQPAAVQPVVAQPSETGAPHERLVPTKSLRKRINIAALESDTAASGAPPNLAGEIVRSLGATLATTGSTLVDRSSGTAVRLTVTSFHSTVKGNLNTGAVTDTLRGIGSMLGRNVPNAPAHARSVSYDVGLAVLVTVYDAQGRQTASARPNCSLNQSRSNVTVDVARLSYGELFVGDTPMADALRQVVAGAADAVLHAAEGVEPDISIRSAHGDSVTLDAGRNANIGPDDVFDVLDGGRPAGRVRVDAVQDSAATARVLTGTALLTGKHLRYAGTAVPESKPAETVHSERFAVVREKSEFRDGPGLSFKVSGTVAPNTGVRILYTIGPWARIEYGRSPAWVPVAALDLM